jgi:hypothetical protein
MSAEGASAASSRLLGRSSAELRHPRHARSCPRIPARGLAVLAGWSSACPSRPRPRRPRSRCGSSPISSESSRSCTASPKRAGSRPAFPAGRGRAGRSSMKSRHRSTSLRAAGGGACRSAARAPSGDASSIGASARSVTSSNLPRWKRSSSMAERFWRRPTCGASRSPRRAPARPRRTPRAPAGRPAPAAVHRGIVAGELERHRIGMAAHDRGVLRVSLRGGSGSRALPIRAGRSAAKVTSRSACARSRAGSRRPRA